MCVLVESKAITLTGGSLYYTTAMCSYYGHGKLIWLKGSKPFVAFALTSI